MGACARLVRAALAAGAVLAWAAAGAGEIAVTLDDLPPAARGDDPVTIVGGIVATLAHRRVPAVGFVIGGAILDHGAPDPARVAALGLWLDAGLELGNHSRSHLAASDVAPAQYEEDAVAGERIVAAALAGRAPRLRYFRPPFLDTGADAAAHAAFEAGLARHGYVVAPVTVANADWVFAAAYAEARRRGLEAGAQRVAEAYLAYTAACLARAEAATRALLGRPLRHILLLHANALNAAALPPLLDLLEARGYRFVTLEEALADPAYRRPDADFVSPDEPWLDRWLRAAGMRPSVPPPVPPFVRQLASRAIHP